MAYTMLLDIPTWDLTLDDSGNIAMTDGGYAVAQNVANAVRLFVRDAYYDQDRGIPHFSVELGHLPPASLVYSHLLRAAKSVDEVEAVSIDFTGIEGRSLKGEITLTTSTGEVANVEI